MLKSSYFFQPPQKLAKFFSLIDATKWQNSCVQFDPIFPQFTANEDCLYLNIITPKRVRINKALYLNFHAKNIGNVLDCREIPHFRFYSGSMVVHISLVRPRKSVGYNRSATLSPRILFSFPCNTVSDL